MQIPKVSLLVYALALGSILPVQADDNAAQAAAMAAMSAKISQLDKEPGNAPPTAEQKAQAQALVTQQKKLEKEKAKKAAQAKKDAEKKASAEAKAQKQAQQKALTDQKIATEAQRQQAEQALAAQKATDMAAIGALAQAPQPSMQTQSIAQAQPVQTSQLNANQAAAIAALNRALAEPDSGTALQPVTQPMPSPVITTTSPGAPVSTAAPAPVMHQTQTASPQPISQLPFYSAPKIPVSDSKEQQLHALLQKYMANEITSGEYQTQRHAILAQP